jgi:hypothetical protein
MRFYRQHLVSDIPNNSLNLKYLFISVGTSSKNEFRRSYVVSFIHSDNYLLILIDLHIELIKI